MNSMMYLLFLMTYRNATKCMRMIRIIFEKLSRVLIVATRIEKMQKSYRYNTEFLSLYQLFLHEEFELE